MKTSEKIVALMDRVECTIYGGKGFSFSREKFWRITLKYEHENVKVEVAEQGGDFDQTLDTAWKKLEMITSSGLPNGSMLPAIEHKIPT